MAENIDIKQLIDGDEVFYPQTDINALVNNGEYAIDDVPTIDSSNLVTSGGVASELALGAVYDVTAHNSSAQFASLQALLTDPNLNTLIPTNIRRGGMSIKFVSDNKYVQYRLTKNQFSTTGDDWERDNDVATTSNQSNSDFDIADEQGNALVRFENGHIRTKNFSSVKNNANIGIDNIEVFNENTNYSIGNIVKYDELLYKFIVAHTAGEWNIEEVEQTNLLEATSHPVDVFDNTDESDLDISDEQDNVLLRLANGHIKTKNFNSADSADVLGSIQAILSNIGFDNIPEFSEEEDYAIGDIVRYEKYVYVFTSEHTAGEWNIEEVEQTNLLEVILDNSTKIEDSTVVVKFSDFKNNIISDDEAIADMFSFSSIFEKRTVVFDKDIEISKAILLTSNTTAIIDGITISQKDYSFDNVFRGANVPLTFTGDDENDYINAQDKSFWTAYLAELPSTIEKIENIKIIGLNGAKIIGNNINATITHLQSSQTQTLVGDYFGIRTHQINFSYADNIEISGLTFTNTRGWAITFDICTNIIIHDIDVTSSVKNGDGIDFRYGCKNVECYNITGYTSDDLIACTCLPDMNASPHDSSGVYMLASQASRNIYMQEDIENLYIENVNIYNIIFKGKGTQGHGMICLSAYGGKVQKINIDNFEEITGGSSKEALIKIYHGYGSDYSDGDINNIRANNIICIKSSYAIACNCRCQNMWLNKLRTSTSLTNITYPEGFKITNS